jgi:hypothetical protein
LAGITSDSAQIEYLDANFTIPGKSITFDDLVQELLLQETDAEVVTINIDQDISILKDSEDSLSFLPQQIYREVIKRKTRLRYIYRPL